MTGSERHQVSPGIEALLAVIRQWLDMITAASTNPELDLRNLRAVLINLKGIIEPDPGIDEALDRLSDAASAYLEEVERAAVMQTEAGDHRCRNGVRRAANGSGESEAERAEPNSGVGVATAKNGPPGAS